MRRRRLRRRRKWDENHREMNSRKGVQGQSRNSTAHELFLCELIPETCTDEVADSDGNMMDHLPDEGEASSSDHLSLVEYPSRVCELIPDICVNGTVITTAPNTTSSTTTNEIGVVSLDSNSTITGNQIADDTDRDELLEALLNHPRVCTLVPQFCENGILAIDSTTIYHGGNSTMSNNPSGDNGNISLTPSLAPTGADNEKTPSAFPTLHSLLVDEPIDEAESVFNISNNATSLSWSPSPAPRAKPPFSTLMTNSIAPSYSMSPPLSKAPATSIQPSVSMHPSNSSIHSQPSPPSISLHPSMSIYTSTTEGPSASISPSFSMPPRGSGISYTQSRSLAPSISEDLVNLSPDTPVSPPPSASALPSLATPPSVSDPPSIASPLPSSHPTVRSCENWKSAPEQVMVDFRYTVQVTSLIATFVPDMEKLILKTVADHLLDCDELRRVAYPNPASVIGYCEPLLAIAKSCWTVESRLKVWTRNARKAKRDVIQVIRQEFDFGDAVQQVIPNNVYVELQVTDEPRPHAQPNLSAGAAVGVTIMCLVVVLMIGALVKVYRWKTIHSATLVRRKDISGNQLMMDGLFPAVSFSEDDMSAALESEDDDGTNASLDDEDDTTPETSQNDNSLDSKSMESVAGAAHEYTTPSPPASETTFIRQVPSTDNIQSTCSGSASFDATSKEEMVLSPRKKSILKKDPTGSSTSNTEFNRPLKRIDAQLSNSSEEDAKVPKPSLQRIDAQFSNPRMDEPQRSLTRMDAQFSNSRMDEAESLLSRRDTQCMGPRIDATAPLKGSAHAIEPDAERCSAVITITSNQR